MAMVSSEEISGKAGAMPSFLGKRCSDGDYCVAEKAQLFSATFADVRSAENRQAAERCRREWIFLISRA
ncbi:hypothetical protein [Desulfovibrio sp. X2]|uniref:hypothetical protein n=1 Tax=Desulfovibrio sp. X2 TaxID=941449 RepID=UPI0012682FCF|nr:hypothetical protein [Desulfovibrio sp. X2]